MYAIVPLVKRRVSGQVPGILGAYGNVGALCFLTLLLFASPTVFFLAIGGAAIVAMLDLADDGGALDGGPRRRPRRCRRPGGGRRTRGGGPGLTPASPREPRPRSPGRTAGARGLCSG